jgi:hypothetical protein
MGDKNACRNFMVKPLGKCALGRSRKRYENDIKMDLGEVGCKDGR